MTHCVGKGCFFSPEDTFGKVIPFKGMAQQIFALAIFIQLQFRIDRHNVSHEIQIAEGHSGFQCIDGNTTVCPQHIIHMQFPDTLFRFLLEGRRIGSKVSIFIPK